MKVNTDYSEDYRLFAKAIVFANDFEPRNDARSDEDFFKNQWVAVIYNQFDYYLESFEIRRLDNFDKVYVIENSLDFISYGYDFVVQLDFVTKEQQQALKPDNKASIKNDVLIITFIVDGEKAGIRYYEICEKAQENLKGGKDAKATDAKEEDKDKEKEKEYQLIEINESKRNELVMQRIQKWSHKEK